MDEIDIYNELIMEHGLASPNKKELTNFDLCELGHNPNCGDEIKVEVKLSEDKTKIEDMSFSGHGCAISQASTSIMIETLKGKNIEDAKRIINIFMKLIKREELSEEEKTLLEDAYAFKNVSNMPARVKCALLSWHTLESILSSLELSK